MSRNKHRVELDRYDVAILSALATNTRLTTVELASIVHLSRTAVSRRISNLKRNHVLNDAAEIMNYESLGFGVRALVDVNANGASSESLRERLVNEPEVLSVAIIAGDGRLSLDVIAIDVDHLHTFIKGLQGIGETSTKIIFTAEKSRLTLVDRMRLIRERNGADLSVS